MAGWILLFVTFLFFTVGMYSVLISKFMPVVGHPVLDFLREDFHYTLLPVFIIPVFIIVVYLNWLGMKFFRHNT